MKRLLDSFYTFLCIFRLMLVMLALLITWTINPILAILRIKTPIRRFLMRQLPGGEVFDP
jgi:hypothetical protein